TVLDMASWASFYGKPFALPSSDVTATAGHHKTAPSVCTDKKKPTEVGFTKLTDNAQGLPK
ncbi:MAG: hypothetical protein MUQ06_05240, partial [Burkholderiaceae bacterium]|nr:hypothetical protein [Burkholderiaceae bacterium]